MRRQKWTLREIEILRDMRATETKYKLKISEEKKATFVPGIGRDEYKTSLTTAGNNIKRKS